MEGLRKGSLFPFLETGRGEESGSRLPCIRRATRQEGSLPVSCASVFLSLPAFWGSDASLPGVRSPPAGLPPFADFACFPGADGLSAPARRPLRHAGKSGGAVVMRRMPHRRQLLLLVEQPCFLPMVRRSGARSFAYRPGCPGRTGAGMTRERPGKSGFSGREQKKHCLLLRLGIWTFDCVREVAAWGR